jgi:hypothetical protein
MSYFPHGSFQQDIALGNIPGRVPANKFGATNNADSGVATDVWDGANTSDNIATWPQPTAARSHSVASSSASDASGGTGAQTVRIYGLKDWNSKEVSEDVVLNGTTGVTTVNSYVVIHRMKVLTCGSAGPNAGDIKATAAVDGTVTAMMLAGEGQTLMAVYGVPSGQTALLQAYYASFERNASSIAASMRLLWHNAAGFATGVFQTKHKQAILTEGSSYIRHIYLPPVPLKGPGILKIEATSSADNTRVDAGFDIVLCDNDS